MSLFIFRGVQSRFQVSILALHGDQLARITRLRIPRLLLKLVKFVTDAE